MKDLEIRVCFVIGLCAIYREMYEKSGSIVVRPLSTYSLIPYF